VTQQKPLGAAKFKCFAEPKTVPPDIFPKPENRNFEGNQKMLNGGGCSLLRTLSLHEFPLTGKNTGKMLDFLARFCRQCLSIISISGNLGQYWERVET
jgi:hypothetical protein